MKIDEMVLVLYDSDEAATYSTTISGWVARDGGYHGENEHSARYAGCTHKRCDGCQKVMKRKYAICDECHEKQSIERYNALTKEDWNELTPVYSDTADEYFFDIDDLVNYLEEHECTIESLRLVICLPQPLPYIDENIFYDVLPADTNGLPDALEKALVNINAVIEKLPPQAFYPGKTAAIVTQEMLE